MAWEAIVGGGDASSGCARNSSNRAEVATILELVDHDMIDMEMPLQNFIMIKEKTIKGTHKMKAAETKAFKEDMNIKTFAARVKVSLGEDVRESL